MDEHIGLFTKIITEAVRKNEGTILTTGDVRLCEKQATEKGKKLVKVE